MKKKNLNLFIKMIFFQKYPISFKLFEKSINFIFFFKFQFLFL
jgi:hypothetical protein